MSTQDVELSAMGSIWTALQTLPDEEAKARCINWALARLGITLNHTQAHTPRAAASLQPASPAAGAPKASSGSDSFEDIVEQADDGRFRVIARDLKAKSRNDAAIRLVHLILYVNETLGGQPKTSSKKFVVPVLREWRAYDANTRVAIAGSPGIKREGDLLSLDVHSRRDAQNYIAQIRDEGTKGTWSASASRARKSGKKDDKAVAK